MTTTVLVSFQMEGIHRWPAARDVFPDVGFLSDFHRHMFHFKLEKLVTHSDRDVEFIRFKREVQEYLIYSYGSESIVLDFNSMSCEQIAEELLNKFECISVEVWEDGENGARVKIDSI